MSITSIESLTPEQQGSVYDVVASVFGADKRFDSEEAQADYLDTMYAKTVAFFEDNQIDITGIADSIQGYIPDIEAYDLEAMTEMVTTSADKVETEMVKEEVKKIKESNGRMAIYGLGALAIFMLAIVLNKFVKPAALVVLAGIAYIAYTGHKEGKLSLNLKSE